MAPRALVEKEDVWLALRYGWRELPRVLTSCWPLIAVAIIAGSIARTFSHSDLLTNLLSPAILTLCVYVPSCIAVRARSQTRALNWSSTLIVIIFLATVVECSWGALPQAIYHGLTLQRFLITGSHVLELWLTIKLSAALPFFLLSDGKMSATQAFGKSWAFVRAETWWRFWGINILAGIVPAIIYWLIFRFARDPLTSPGSLLVTVLEQILFCIPLVWATIAQIAIISTSPQLATRDLEASLNPTQ